MLAKSSGSEIRQQIVIAGTGIYTASFNLLVLSVTVSFSIGNMYFFDVSYCP
jgi:hypothetical protein